MALRFEQAAAEHFVLAPKGRDLFGEIAATLKGDFEFRPQGFGGSGAGVGCAGLTPRTAVLADFLAQRGMLIKKTC